METDCSEAPPLVFSEEMAEYGNEVNLLIESC
jgi:hypothetical protein